MAITISIALQKGGVGKSTTAQNIAANLSALHGKRVLLVDLDSQANVTYSSGVTEPDKTITDLLGDDCTASEAVTKCTYYDLIPADDYLTNVELAEVEPTLLKDALKPLQSNYDFIILDTPPALGNLSYNALVASDYVIIPTEARPYSLQGLGRLNTTIQNARNALNPALKVLGVVLIKYHERTVLNRDIKVMIDEYTDQMETSLFNTYIREGVVVGESQMCQMPLIAYAKKTDKPNVDYIDLTAEIIEKVS